MHLKADLYVDALRGEVPLSALARQAHVHLLEVCERCSREVAAYDSDLPTSATSPSPPATVDPLHLRRSTVEAAKGHLSQLRAVATEAREDLARLLRLPQDRWLDRVAGARTRMRSRAFVEHLIAESRARVRTEPLVAAALAALAPTALRWAAAENPPWLSPLLARATAHQANALRIAGDLPAASELFQDLATATATEPLAEPSARAEVASLEASFCIDQRFFDRAAKRLRSAIDDYSQAYEPEGVARTLILSANLMQTLGEPEKIVPLLDRAAAALGDEPDPYLLATTVTGRVNALCDLDRAGEAEPLLREHRAVYLDQGDELTAANFTLLSGRVAHGVGRFDDAEAHLADARDRLLGLDRDYDAIITSLYLADTLLAARRTTELKDLAASLVPLFQSRGVARETLAALRLLAEAAQTQALTSTVLARVRDRLQVGR